MHFIEQLVTHDLTGDSLGFIIQQHNMVAIPAHRTADVQQQARHIEHGGGNFVGDHFGWMKMSCIQAQRRLATGGIAEIKLVRAYGVALSTYAKQLALNCIDMMLRIHFF